LRGHSIAPRCKPRNSGIPTWQTEADLPIADDIKINDVDAVMRASGNLIELTRMNFSFPPSGRGGPVFRAPGARGHQGSAFRGRPVGIGRCVGFIIPLSRPPRRSSSHSARSSSVAGRNKTTLSSYCFAPRLQRLLEDAIHFVGPYQFLTTIYVVLNEDTEAEHGVRSLC
jgi:hypothetical protein